MQLLYLLSFVLLFCRLSFSKPTSVIKIENCKRIEEDVNAFVNFVDKDERRQERSFVDVSRLKKGFESYSLAGNEIFEVFKNIKEGFENAIRNLGNGFYFD